uniref:Uncharacterized protein isoform X6 n=1 Tax=Nicotiana tabacum TaxID=4097 RepID=A0A1S3ZZK5_TOBAC|nr:PREDICTED: uncharacterized protein LOC107792071 isoform X6 [Nicotiana tabacum]
MYPERRNKWPYAEHPNSDKNVRRHDIYGQISPDKKETMLLQRRTKELERQKWNSSIKSTVDPDERVMYQCHPMIRKDSALTITEASSADDEVGSKHDVNTSSSSLDKGKNVGHASSVFERGSTSRIYKGQHNVFPIATRKERFQYEPPGFCCGSGSVKLVSYELPNELSNLYKGNTEEA